MLSSNYKINLIGGSCLEGVEVYELEAERIVQRLKALGPGDLLQIDFPSGIQVHIPCWQILSIENTPVVEVG